MLLQNPPLTEADVSGLTATFSAEVLGDTMQWKLSVYSESGRIVVSIGPGRASRLRLPAAHRFPLRSPRSAAPLLPACIPTTTTADAANMTMAHIHQGNATTNGPPVVILLPLDGPFTVRLQAVLRCPLAELCSQCRSAAAAAATGLLPSCCDVTCCCGTLRSAE